MGRYHARAAAAAGASIAAIVDPDQNARKALASRFDSAPSFDKLARALQAVEADAVHICTPAETHVQLCEPSADAGLHALVEKPLAATASETSMVLERFAKAGRFACPTHQYAFQRSVESAVAEFPRLGTLRRIAFDICSAGGDRSGMDLDELVGEILPHPLAMVQKFIPSADLSAVDWTCLRTSPGEWQIHAPVDGVVLTLSMSMSGRPTRFLTEITADRGTIELDNFHDFSVPLSGAVSRAQKIAAPFVRDGLGLYAAGKNLVSRALRSEFAYPGLTTLVDAFYQAVRDPQAVPPPITPEQAIAVAEARDRIIQLAGHG
jgi:predicted dehydrogenase